MFQIVLTKLIWFLSVLLVETFDLYGQRAKMGKRIASMSLQDMCGQS